MKWEVDLLVPLTNRDHPIWWVLPPKKFDSPRSLAEQFLAACNTHKYRDLLDAILSLAARKEGWPAFGIWIDKKTGEPSKEEDVNKKFLGENTVTCEYRAEPESIRQTLVAGYYIGTRHIESQ